MVPAPEVRKGHALQNPVEAELVRELCSTLVQAGIEEREIGVISPYRSQLQAIRNVFLGSGMPDVEIDTIDRYQGRDKDVIVMSLVRAGSPANLGTHKMTVTTVIAGQVKHVRTTLLQDWRRVNVAITRAKTKLIMVGCKSTLQVRSPFARAVIQRTQGGNVCEFCAVLKPMTASRLLLVLACYRGATSSVSCFR